MWAVSQRRLVGKGSCIFEELAVESSRGEEGVAWQTMGNAGERPVHTRNVGVLFLIKSESEKNYEGC